MSGMGGMAIWVFLALVGGGGVGRGGGALVWVDWWGVSHVVVCSVCRASWVFLSKAQAVEQAQTHRAMERGRTLPRCVMVGCVDHGVAQGLCRSHYNRAHHKRSSGE